MRTLIVGLFLVAAGLAAAASPGVTLVPATPQQVLAAIREPGARVVLVNVWATWCIPCREEFPDLLRLEREYAARGLRLVLVSADFGSNADGALQFLASQGARGKAYLKTGPDEPFMDALDPAWSGALPATFVFDENGRRLSSWEGRLTYPQMVDKIRPALEPASAP